MLPVRVSLDVSPPPLPLIHRANRAFLCVDERDIAAAEAGPCTFKSPPRGLERSEATRKRSLCSRTSQRARGDSSGGRVSAPMTRVGPVLMPMATSLSPLFNPTHVLWSFLSSVSSCLRLPRRAAGRGYVLFVNFALRSLPPTSLLCFVRVSL